MSCAEQAAQLSVMFSVAVAVASDAHFCHVHSILLLHPLGEKSSHSHRTLMFPLSSSLRSKFGSRHGPPKRDKEYFGRIVDLFFLSLECSLLLASVNFVGMWENKGRKKNAACPASAEIPPLPFPRIVSSSVIVFPQKKILSPPPSAKKYSSTLERQKSRPPVIVKKIYKKHQ